MRTRLAALVVLSIQILAYESPESAEAQGLCSKESAAIAAASDLLTKLRFSSEYVAGRAYGRDSGDKWSIWIPRASEGGGEKIVLPASGLVEG